MDFPLQTIVDQSKEIAQKFSRARSLDGSLSVSLGGPDNVKVYASTTHEYSALFVVIALGEDENALRLVNIYGSFDEGRLGGSVNLPPSEAAPSQPMLNPMMMQMIAFQGDAAGAAFFAKPDGPPRCEAFNYCVVVMGMGADGTFGIKPSAWKQGDADAYSFKLSELTQLSMQDLGNLGLWCKAPTAPASEVAEKKIKTKATVNVWLIAAVASLVLFAAFLVLRRR